jgi:hypothetical protein
VKFKVALHILSPILIGVFIYLFLRPVWPNAVISFFYFFEINISPPIINTSHFINSEIYRFLLFNLSDALWAYSFSYFISFATQKESLLVRRIYHFIAFFIATTQELLQGSIIVGTYDTLDLILIWVAYTLAIKIFRNTNEKPSVNY